MSRMITENISYVTYQPFLNAYASNVSFLPNAYTGLHQKAGNPREEKGTMKCADCKLDNACYKGKSCYDQGFKQPEYQDAENLGILMTASRLEAEHYMKMTRLEELIHFSREMGYKRLGMAFCVGLSREAKDIAMVLGRYFEVHSVCCKVCGVDKKEFGIPNIKQERYEAACNPIGQAKYLREAKTEINIIVGLCVGHDMLFTKYSEAPVTTLVAKDRVLAHNPLGAIYSNYWRRQIMEDMPKPD
ncbi:hypothetical protein CEB3_c30970 [Peptococcaceae bacterium CEB3]|nr:hypothetical protein CEB3_c30970 [Peptococcaceae bacterium CEB3]